MSELSRFQKFTVRRLQRSALRNAPYNPRFMDPYARQKLEANLKRVGLLGPVIWNERTGNLVGGHQRLAAMDAVERGPDYELDVAVVDLDEKTEKAQNVFLNNPSAQGSWDAELLAELLKTVDLDPTGFDPMDIQVLIDDVAGSVFAPQAHAPAAQAAAAAALELVAAGAAARQQAKGEAEAAGKALNYEPDLKQRLEERTAANLENDDTERFAVVVFANAEDRREFFTRLGLQNETPSLPGAVVKARLEGRPVRIRERKKKGAQDGGEQAGEAPAV